MNQGELKYYRFEGLLQQQGWLKPAYVGVDTEGDVKFLSDTPPEAGVAIESVMGYAVPGFPNAHSHAFQFAMAGMAEKHLPGSSDDFWTWRTAMYRCALSLSPDQMEAVAAMLYSQMIRKGYTHVAEFHYLHHDPEGKQYANSAEMGERLLAAADAAGIKITLVPVFYQKGGFGRGPLPEQRRFISPTVDEYLTLLQHSHHAVKQHRFASLGFGVHSLRAVSAEDIIRTFELGPRDLPFHLHAAEQLREVRDAENFIGLRPVSWLLENLPLNNRFHLVHCTHLDDDEVRRLAQGETNVILCPGTEANLGDGVFRLIDYAAYHGNWSIGTDSHISLNPLEDLRWLDYIQRLQSHKRNTFDDAATLQFQKCVPSGRRAMGISSGNFFEMNKPLDAVIYRSDEPLLVQAGIDHLLSALVYTADASAVLGTLIDGRWVCKNGESRNGAAIRARFMETIGELKR
jgi:formimidoylglutamate deiminase